MRFRAGMAATAAALLLLFGAVDAYADHGFSISRSEAAAGERTDFSISGSRAGETYLLHVEDQQGLAWGTDFGDGISDWFEMPDFGASSRTVSVVVEIQPSDPNEAPHTGSQPMTYLPAASEGVLSPAPIIVPAAVKTEPEAQTTAPNNPPTRTPTRPGRLPKEDNPISKKDTGSDKKTETPAANLTPSTPSSTESSGGTRSRSSTGGATRQPDVPAGPTGPAVPLSPEGSASAIPALTPLSGLVGAGKTSFPTLLIILFLLVLAAVLTAAGPRLWQRYEPQLAISGPPTDDMRLGALSRASASGAELQKTIAARRATRGAGRVG